ncbi:MAG: type III pantothenate kinase, partial [Armatimonadetes bacterium]|nr:type III pantothenate kinase [Armatimonadota bacterium]
MKLLALDIGNSNITAGVFAERRLLATWRLVTDRQRTADEYGVLLTAMLAQEGIAPADVGGVAVCSVVPPLAPTV